ncbi:MAG: 30S ribosome-binding factor RbfA [Acidimicrobiaceae bacterium]|nr:30S ribosome-binding factor RbfA [Acidimicrobiaceae bacterium]MBO0747697.1 30S ribosome-binding factor RbfA [Acidimicrobiaceae bacterium]
MSPASRRGGRRAGRPERPAKVSAQRYPRSARVNNLLREVLADALERLAAGDERLTMVTITDVHCDPDLHAATLFFASLDDEQMAGLADARVRLQAEVARQVRLKRTPLLSFAADPAIASGNRIEDILRGLSHPGEAEPGEGPEPPR